MASGNASPLAVSLLSEQHDTKNELTENDGTAVDFVNEAIATVIPVSTVISMMAPLGSAQISSGAGIANLQTANPLQRNRNSTKSAILRNQQTGSRTAIKSSSPSATANNNTATQKFHKTDAAMLNYIFDSHLASKHRHYDPRYVYVCCR